MAAGKAAREALERMLPKADDWGWTGGKRGEVTGDKYLKEFRRLFKKEDYSGLESLVGKADRQLDRNTRVGDVYRRLKDAHLQNGSDPYFAKRLALDTVMTGFKALEDSGVPRRWTGKVLPTLITPTRSRLSWLRDGSYSLFLPDYDTYDVVGKTLKSVPESKRDVFVTLLPDWDDDIDELAKTVRNL